MAPTFTANLGGNGSLSIAMAALKLPYTLHLFNKTDITTTLLPIVRILSSSFLEIAEGVARSDGDWPGARAANKPFRHSSRLYLVTTPSRCFRGTQGQPQDHMHLLIAARRSRTRWDSRGSRSAQGVLTSFEDRRTRGG